MPIVKMLSEHKVGVIIWDGINMATIDIRGVDEDSVIDKIVFADDGEAFAHKLAQFDEFKCYIESSSNVLSLRIKDIPNLIKALQHAQQIWKD